jgi:endonuclease III
MAPSSLSKVLTALKKRYGKPKPVAAGRDPLALISWEMVAYLADDDTRHTAFAALKKRVGLAPDKLLEVPLPALTDICRLGGPVHPLERAKRIKLGAAIAMDEFGGDLAQVLKWDYSKAVKALRKFPSVGEPGADRILMLCESHAVLGLDSNALRVLIRLGYGADSPNYTKAYRSARDAAMAVLPKKAAVLAEASRLLREHGKETCKTAAPRCQECPVTAACAYFNARRGPTPTADRSPRTRSRAPSTRKSPG